jgi:RsiW-degrading membrane proteinase PrsW (M82 family)
MSKSKIVTMATMAILSVSQVALALEEVPKNPEHSGPAWLAVFAAFCGFILAWSSVVMIYMMVSGKAGKYSE